MSEERGADTDYTQTIILQAQQEETNSAEDQNFSDFSIPIDMVGGGDKGDFDQDLYGRISLSDQLSLNTSDLNQAGDIRNHVISIEENGRIMIRIDSQFQGGAGWNLSTILEEPLVTPRHPHIPPKFPEWWLRLSSTSPRVTWWTRGWSAVTARLSPPTSCSSATPPRGWPRGWWRLLGTPRRRPSPSASPTGTATPWASSSAPCTRASCPPSGTARRRSGSWRMSWGSTYKRTIRGQACYDIVKKHNISSENGNYQVRAE